MNFFDNPIIKQLAHNPRWTVNIDGKCPLDILTLKNTGRICGAASEERLVTLPDLLDIMGIMQAMPERFTYFLDAERDRIAVLDIEKHCPEDIKNELLNLDFLYGDISASGKGYHLAFICPELDEITRNKIKMQHKDKHYEILLHHYVTFTQNLIFPTATPAKITFRDVWDELVKEQKIAAENAVNINISARPEFSKRLHKKLFAEIMRALQNRFLKTPADYNNDMSRYEFGVIGIARTYLEQMLSFTTFANLEMDDNDKIWMVYDAVSEFLPHRDKHDAKRDGQPFLFYLVCKSFTTVYKN